jgi:5-oxoprolinase (ATP-hydrolysing)
MPSHSKHLWEEGMCVKSFKLVVNGIFQEEGLKELLMAPAKLPGCSGSRNLHDNISDLRAQVAANQKGITLVTDLIDAYGLDVVQAYMGYIQENAEIAVREMLKEIGTKTKNETGKTVLYAEDKLDDGSAIVLKITISEENGSAVFDFTGTGLQVPHNLNAPRQVTFSAILYCLRCMVGYDVPLNQGCLKPIEVIIPSGSLLDPSDDAAVIGGNVLTSQRVVDVVFKAFSACAASQGCMNNTTFGDESFGYYETVAGGAGAGPTWHGRSGIHTHMTNTRITDPEILERRYPVVLRQFSLNPSTGGAGQFYGGDGVIRELQFRKPLTLTILSERRVHSPYGLQGGAPGSKGKNTVVRRDGSIENVGGKAQVHMATGDTFRLESPGGGGFGEPVLESPPAAKKAKTFAMKGSLMAYRMKQDSA